MSKFKKHRKEKGSITLFVLLSILFFIVIAYAVYANTANSIAEQNRETKSIQMHYEQTSTVEEMENEYNEIVGEKILISLFFADSDEAYSTEQWTNKDLKVKIRFPDSVPKNERYYTIDGVTKKYEGDFIIEQNCTIISEYKDMNTEVNITRIDKIKPTVTLTPNGGNTYIKTGGYYCSICKDTFNKEHYHCPTHSDYYSATPGTCKKEESCSGTLKGSRITSYSGSSGCVVVGCNNPATKNVWVKCDACGKEYGTVTCDSHASYSTYFDVNGYGCSTWSSCGQTLVNTSTEQPAEDGTIETKIVATDAGGSGLNTLQYAWSTSKETEPTEQEWKTFENGETVNKTDCGPGSYYLWTKVSDIAGNIVTNVSSPFIVKVSEITEDSITMTPNPSDWTNQDVIVTIDYDDKIKGDKVVTVTGEEGKDYEIVGDTEVIIKTNDQTITVTVEDENGNKVQKDFTVTNIDKIKPTVTLNPNGGNIVMPDKGDATIKTTLTAKDEGGSGLNTLEYAWSTSKDVEPQEGWTEFKNEETISKTDCKPGSYYLWTRVTDVAGSRADEIKVSQEFKVTKAENPMTVTNTTAKVGEVIDLSELVDNAKGTVSYQIKNQTTQGSTISGSTLTVGENAADSDDNKVVVITVTDTGNGNYDGISKDITITVEKYTRTLEWDSVTPDSLEFGDNSKKAVAKVTGEGGIAGDITYQSSRTDYLLVDKTTGALTTVKADGSSEITAVMASTTTVKGATITKTITVKKSPTATVVQEEDKIYNGVNQIGVNGNHVTWKGTREAIDAGSYTVTATPEENYTWSDGSTTAKTITWKIEPKSVAITWGQTTSFVYNGQPQAPTASATSGISGETLNITRSTGTNVGSYTSTATLAGVTGGRGKTSNYTLTNTTKAFTITNATITGSVTIKGENEYGSTLTAETVVNPGDAELTYQWYYNDENSTTGGTPIEGANKKDYTIGDGLVGKHIYVVVTAKKPNYSDITFTDITDKNNNGSETVRKKTLQKPTIDGNYVYNGKEQTLNLNNYNGNDMTITGNTGIDAGDYTTTITLKDTENYQWSDGSSASITITWKINPKEIAVKWEDRTSFIFNGQPQAPTASAESGVSGETLNITRTMQTAIGSYTSTASLVSVTGGRGKTSNYKLTNTTKDYRITDAVITGTVTIKGNNQYGSTLTAETVVEPSDATLSYQWYYNTSNSTSGGTAISGATGKTYTVGSGLAGKYIYVVVTAKKTNYKDVTFSDITDATNNGSATVAKIKVTKPTASGTFTYNGNTQTLSVSGYNSSTMNISGNTGVNAGSYTATVTLKDSSNYQWSDGSTGNVTFSWKINPKSVSVEWGTTTSFVYNGSAQAPTAKASSGVSGETLNITRTTQVNAGSYTSTASISSVSGGQGKASNYTLTNTQKAYTITRAKTATASAANKTYNGASQTGVSGSNVTWSGTTSATNAGTYSATATPTSNYAWSDGTTGAKSISWTMNKKTVSVTWGSTTSFTYNGSAQAPTASASSGVSGETLNITRTTQVNAGSYTSTASLSSVTGGQGRTSNYTLTNTTKAYTITRAKTATASSANKTYNGASQTGVSGSKVTWSGTTSATNAGTYSATATPTSNYAWSDGTTGARSVSWTINKKSVSVTWGSTTSFTYNGSAQAPTASASSGVSGETLNITRTTQVNAGSYTSTASLSSVTGGRGKTSNYTLTNTTKAYTITRAKTATASSTNKTYNGASQTGVSGSNVRWSGTTSAIDAGTYSATATPTSNYAWSDGTTGARSVSWTINKKSVSVTWGSTTSFTYNGSAQAPTASASSGVSGETLNITRTTQVNAGSYTSTASLSSVTGGRAKTSNYTLTNTTKAYTINKKSSRVSSSSYSGNYDGSSHTITLTVSEPTSGYTIYYSTSTSLNSSNYTSGTTTKPTRSAYGTTTVYWYVRITNGNYTDASGSNTITIKDATAPTVTYNPNGGSSFTVGSNGYATIKTTITVTDSGGSGLNTGSLQYAWSTSATSAPSSEWRSFSSGQTVSKTDCGVGSYYVWVKASDNAGNTTTKASSAFVISSPTVRITTNPTAKTVVVNNNATFTVAATGTGVLSYQWYYNTSNSTSGGTLISGATGTSYTIKGTTGVDKRYYYCVVTSKIGTTTATATSSTALLRVVTVSITKQPANQTAVNGNTFTFTVTGSGSSGATISYQWYYSANSSSASNWQAASTSSTYSGTANAGLNGRYIYCKVTATLNGVSTSVNSSTVRLTTQTANYSTLKSGKTTYYTNLQNAINGATSGGGDSGGGTITTLNTQTDNSAASTNKTITLYLNGKTITRSSSITTTGGTLTVKGSGTLNCTADATALNGQGGHITVTGNPLIKSQGGAVYLNNNKGGNLNISTGYFYSTGRAAVGSGSGSSGSMTINNATVYTDCKDKAALYITGNGTVNLTGTLVGSGGLNKSGLSGTGTSNATIALLSKATLNANNSRIFAGIYGGPGISRSVAGTINITGDTSIYANNNASPGQCAILLACNGSTVTVNTTGYIRGTHNYVIASSNYSATYNIKKGIFSSKGQYKFYKSGAALTNYKYTGRSESLRFQYMNAYNRTVNNDIKATFYTLEYNV